MSNNPVVWSVELLGPGELRLGVTVDESRQEVGFVFQRGKTVQIPITVETANALIGMSNASRK